MHNNRFTTIRLLSTISLALAALSANAGPSQSDVTAPGGFVTSCALSNAGSGFVPGSDLSSIFGAANCNSSLFSGSASASASKSYSSGATTNSSSGTVSLGQIHMSASNNAPNSSYFHAAASNGGWADTLTIDMPGLTGQSGIYLAKIDVTGTLAAHGFAGASSFNVTAYKDKAELLRSVPGFFGGAQATTGGTDRQRVSWGVATYGGSYNDASSTIDDYVIFAVPIVFGESFSLGVYGYISAGMRSSSGVPGNSTADADFSHSVIWDGVAGVRDSMGNLVTGYSLTSASGIDWTQSMVSSVPEPEAYAMLVAGLALVGAVRRRQRKQD